MVVLTLRNMLTFLTLLNLFLHQEVLSASISNISSFDYLRVEYPHGEEELVRLVDPCGPGGTLVEIRKKGSTPVVVYETICHAENDAVTLWTKHNVFGAELFHQDSAKRPNWLKGSWLNFFPNMNIHSWYTIKEQFETFTTTLGSKTEAKKYIKTDGTGQGHLAIGHLSPFKDHKTKDKQRATQYFLNATPQWQSINNGNWKKLEKQIKRYAKFGGSLSYTIYTGTYGIMTLPNTNNENVDIFLGLDSPNGSKKLPVSEFIWKIIHDESTRQAVAVIIYNNPFATNPPGMLCEDVCNKVPLVNWDRRYFWKGYTYCCEVKKFREIVVYAPDIGDVALFNFKLADLWYEFEGAQ